MKNPSIRFVETKDLEALVALCKLHAAFEQSEFKPETKTETLKKHLFSKTPTLFCLVVEHKNEIIGYTTYMKQFSTWDADFYIYMDCLFLTETSRGFGIGELLINRLKQEAVQHNCKQIQWQTPSFNTRAMAFYNRIGADSKSKERFFITA